MRSVLQTLTAACALLVAALSPALAADAKPHRVAIQVDQNDPAVMNLALNNATNIMETYKDKGEEVEIELVAYGPGLNMLRDDTSPVKDRIKQIAELSFPSRIRFSACNITKMGMEKREGHPIAIVPEASLVPSGAIRLIELQESGWSYLKP
ncbi:MULTISPECIES: DsrE family protein [unclassified Bradyrhizobium]|uniref:DsrE family protein n=1 Tax=unclassified Bradyrhizobium TaxID=2631580 RepID=UPI0028E801F9|nr:MULTISPECIES: DsrE family protein [unclassified Bradyrhizobium]